MGRTALSDAERRAKEATAARQEALGEMNPALRKKVEQIEKLTSSTRESNLIYYHKLGQHVLDVRQNADGQYGTKVDKPITLLEKALWVQKRTLRKAATFADLYSQDDLDELIGMSDPESSVHVHWGHMTYILTLATKAQRKEFTKMVLTKKMDPPALHAAIKRRQGSGKKAHGRKMECPKTIHAQIRQMMETTRVWLGKHDTVWYGDEVNIIENILGATPEEVGQEDLENMQALVELLQEMTRVSKEFQAPVKKAVKAMEKIVKERDATNQADESHETLDKGRQHRAIDISGDGGGNGKPKATAQAKPKLRRRAQQPQPTG